MPLSPPAAPAPGLTIRRFSTRAVEPRLRHAAWAAQGWPSVARAVDAAAEPGFAAESETIAVGPLQIIFGHYGAQTIRRTAERRRAAPLEALNVALVLSGGIDGSWARIGPGEIGLCDMTEEFGHRSATGSMVTFALPRTVALEHGLDPQALHGATLPGPAAAMLRSHLEQIRAAAPTLAASEGARLARTVVDLLAIALAGAGRVAPPPVDQATHGLKHQAEAAIVAGIHDPGLGVDQLRRTLGVSRATLYRLFEEDGGVRRRIRDERLRAARVALAAPEARVGDIAEAFGFSDASHFSRAFRAAFGVAPRDWRAGER